ncbi:MAG: efflux RND transporter permease subunit, partial [Gemmatimonadota bacterium]
MIRLSIRRPVAVAMAYLAVGILGMAAWRNIPIELYPDTQLPRLQIQGNWYGASPETIEAFLTSPIEGTVQQVRGVEKVTSESYEEQGMGISSVTVEFNRDTDMDFARLDLGERLATLEEELPPGVGSVTVSPYIPPEFAQQAGMAFLRYTLTGPYTLEAL